MQKLFLPMVLFVFVGCAPQKTTPAGEQVVHQRYLHSYGVEVAKEDWSKRGEFGQVISKMADGVIVTKNYSGGLLDGESTYTFPYNDTVQKVMTYNKGHLDREHTFYKTMLPQRKIEYISYNQRNTTEWYETGEKRCDVEYDNKLLVKAIYYDINGQMEGEINEGEGIRVNRDCWGQLLSMDEIRAGELVMRTLYYSNGNPQAMIPYDRGLIEGEKRTFLPDGQPESIQEWVADQQHGKTLYFENGEKLIEVAFQHGKRHGVERKFADGEQVAEQVSWFNDQRHGPAYSNVGSKRQMRWYYKDDEVTHNTYEWLHRTRAK